MQVVAESTFTFFYNHAPVTVAKGKTVKSDAAVHLLRTGSPVRPDDDEAEQLAASLREQAEAHESEPPADGEQSDPDATEDEIPTGTNGEVLAWVGDDPDRARRARDAETAEGGKNRPRLLAALDEIAG